MESNEYKGIQGRNDFDFPKILKESLTIIGKAVKVLVILILFQIQQGGFSYENIYL